MISINNNLAASNVANTLTSHYGRLQTSTQRLSSGLRINGAADDAAGLAIRELMRADVAALRQGMRNVNDGISMLQTFDGALGIIDEKLIRMKELAEQAATGTYDSTQRLMIDSEFQAMGAEIDRIANATDFNGIKLLCTKMISWFTDEDLFVVTNPGSLSGLQLPAGNNGTPVLNGVNPAKFVDKNNPATTISISLTATESTDESRGPLAVRSVNGTTTEYALGDTQYSVAYVNAMGKADNAVIQYSKVNNSDAAKGWTITDANQGYDIFAVADGTTSLRAVSQSTDPALTSSLFFSMNDKNSGPINLGKIDPAINSIVIDTGASIYSITRSIVEMNANTADYTASYNADTSTVTVNLKKGGTATLVLAQALKAGDTVSFDLEFEGEIQTVPVEHWGVDPDQKLKIHFGTLNDSAEDYYYVNYANCTLEGLGLDDVDIQTQEKAQEALVQVNDAIVAKDKVRAYFGATQNRLENTFSNLSIQAENLQAAESRISDADIAQEMMIFVRNQILTQSAVAMLAQANMMPQMVMSLIR